MSYVKETEVIDKMHVERKEFKKLEDWRGNEFESSCYKTPEFTAFARMYRARVNGIAKQVGLKAVSWNVGHFYLSAMFKHGLTGQHVYLSTSDVRHFQENWWNHILVRTAKHDKDWTGGSNCSATLHNLNEWFTRLAR